MNKLRTLGTFLLAGAITPAGVLFSQSSAATVTANGTYARHTDPASTGSNRNVQNKFSKIQDLAQNVRKDVGPLKSGTNGTELNWQIHAQRMARVKRSVNQMETDINQLQSQKASLAPWQQQLLGNLKEDTNEMVYQTSAALKVLNAHHDKMALVTTSYPQNIDMISQKANDAATSIGAVFQRHGVDID